MADEDRITAGELRKLLKDKSIKDDIPLGVTDHFGEIIFFDWLPEVRKARPRFNKPKISALIFQAIDIGPEPD